MTPEIENVMRNQGRQCVDEIRRALKAKLKHSNALTTTRVLHRTALVWLKPTAQVLPQVMWPNSMA